MPLGRTAEKLRRKGLLRQTDKMRVSGEVFFSDTTLRDGEQMPGVSFSPSVKAQIARDLEAVGVHSIEAGFAAAGEIEVRAISAVSAAVSKPIVVSLARARASDIDLAAEALCSRPRHKRGVAVFLATSSAHREHKLGMSRLEVLRSIERALHRASDHFDIIAFGAEDASRTEPDFLADCLRVAIDAGATSVGVPDTLGLLTPKTAADFLRRLQDDVPNIEGALIAAHFHNDLGLATANSLAAIEAGVHIVQCTVGGLGERAGNAALEEIALILALHGHSLHRRSAIDTTKLLGLCRRVAEFSRVPLAPHKAVAGNNIFATEAGLHQDGLLKNPLTYTPYDPGMIGGPSEIRLALGKHSGRAGLKSRLSRFGIVLEDSALDELLARIKALPQPSDADNDAVLQNLASEAATGKRL